MKQIFLIFSIFVLAGLAACQKNDLPSNPTIVSPINSLVLTVNGVDYIAKPSLIDGAIDDTLILNVQKPNDTAIVKQLTLSSGLNASGVGAGQALIFTNNLAAITVTGANTTTTYLVKMTFAPPPLLFVPLSSEGYVVNEKTQLLAAGNYDNFYEGYVGFSESWLGFYVVTPSTPAVQYGISAGFDDGSTQILHSTTSDAPWGDWGTNAVWRFNYNSTTYALTLVKTNWAITGSATGGAEEPLVYSTQTRLLTITSDLSAGSLIFDAQSSPVLTYGDGGSTSPNSKLISNGKPVNIASAGNYTITMDLSNPPYYVYQVVKN
jgi:hypothetical protein